MGLSIFINEGVRFPFPQEGLLPIRGWGRGPIAMLLLVDQAQSVSEGEDEILYPRVTLYVLVEG